MMKFGSGIYNVRESEVMQPDGGHLHRTLQCSVYFLDGSQNDFDLERHARGQELLDKVFGHLELIEKDYFGLQFVDLAPEDRDVNNMRWLEANKSIRKQMQCPPYVLYFRVKFYVSDPSKIQEEYTRYHFYLQLRKDILENRLTCPESSAALLGSYAAQSEFGDYSPEDHGDSYLDSFQVVTNQTMSLINKIKELHKLHAGQHPADAEFNFLDHAKRLEMYGVDLYQAKDASGTAIELGVAGCGIVVFQNRQRINTFSWANVVKISFKRKQFFVHLKNEDSAMETVVGFNLNSTGGCKLLWKSCIEHHTFFRLISPPQLPHKSLFNLGSRYRYSGRTEYQTLEEMKRRARVERTFHRAGSKSSYARSTVSGSQHAPSSSAATTMQQHGGAQHPAQTLNDSCRLSSSAVSSGVGSSAGNTPLASPLLNGMPLSGAATPFHRSTNATGTTLDYSSFRRVVDANNCRVDGRTLRPQRAVRASRADCIPEAATEGSYRLNAGGVVPSGSQDAFGGVEGSYRLNDGGVGPPGSKHASETVEGMSAPACGKQLRRIEENGWEAQQPLSHSWSAGGEGNAKPSENGSAHTETTVNGSLKQETTFAHHPSQQPTASWDLDRKSVV